MLDVCLLGCGGVMPLPDRWLTALLLRHNGKMILVDCGEGTQVPMKMLGWGFKSLEAVVFTHYHGDHAAGLPGLLLTLGNAGREEPLWLAGPPGLKEVVEGLRVIAPELPYEIQLKEFSDQTGDQLSIGEIMIQSLPVEHTLTCLSYCFMLGRAGRFHPEKAKALGIPLQYWRLLQNGQVVRWEGKTFAPSDVMGEPRPGLKISYCTDTRPTGALSGFVQGADLLVCEGMYGEDEKLPKAQENGHMLFSEAAALAAAGRVNELWLTHFSPALTQPEEHLIYARRIFANTKLGSTLLQTTLRYRDMERDALQ